MCQCHSAGCESVEVMHAFNHCKILTCFVLLHACRSMVETPLQATLRWDPRVDRREERLGRNRWLR